MSLREELIETSDILKSLRQENFQLNIENEDLRDRLQMITNDKGYSIEY
jgi:regulator of replication initiation timing